MYMLIIVSMEKTITDAVNAAVTAAIDNTVPVAVNNAVSTAILASVNTSFAAAVDKAVQEKVKEMEIAMERRHSRALLKADLMGERQTVCFITWMFQAHTEQLTSLIGTGSDCRA
jgi:hypothetical protein